MRPGTDFNETKDSFYTLNPRKREMQKETKCTEIERENRLLLEKINHIMGKKRASSEAKIGSLNSSLRKKQCQSIEVENAKMLRRLQERKSDYELGRFKKEWRRTKQMIKNITSYPLVIEQIQGRRRKKSHIEIDELRRIATTNPEDFQLVKMRLINTKKFIVTLKFTPAKFVIIGDIRADKELKVIEIDKDEALKFIEENCAADIHKVFDCLRYDETEKSLYLVAPDQLQGNSESLKDIEREEGKARPRQKRQMSHKPIYEGVDFAIMDREDLIF